MKKLTHLLTAALMMGSWVTIQAPVYAAMSETPAKKAVKKPIAKHKVSKNKAANAAESKSGALLDDDDKVFEAGNAGVTEISCELGNKVTLYRNENDPEHIALRWNQRVHRMTKVSTTTGANRFENTRYGLTWIGIPAKGMLLDSKKGKQLANECKDASQSASAMMPAGAPAQPTKPADVPSQFDPQRAAPKL